MKKQTIIITGASTGIGKGIARRFIQNGDNVVINSANEERLRATFEELDAPDNVALLAGDVSDIHVGQALVSLALDRFGSVDVLINNAGVFSPKPFLEVQEQDLDRFLSINLKGTFFTTQAAIRQMLKQQGGVIINIGAALAEHAIAGVPVTAPMASKGAIHALTLQLAAEFGRSNIRVNTIAPGVIRTPLQAKTGVQNADVLAPLHLLYRVGEVEDIAEMALLVASSNFITGAILTVDGGHVAGHHIDNSRSKMQTT
jgi:NAD(P)-dependent dehydrogenase (short-subunit alcohol dehydrogenase family)